MDNILVFRDDFHLETAARLIPESAHEQRRCDLAQEFNSVFTGRTPRTDDALKGFVDMMTSMLGAGGDARPGQGGIAPFVRTRYSFVFIEPEFNNS